MRHLLLSLFLLIIPWILNADAFHHDDRQIWYNHETGNRVELKFKKRSIRIKGLGTSQSRKFRKEGRNLFIDRNGNSLKFFRRDAFEYRSNCGRRTIFSSRRHHMNRRFGNNWERGRRNGDNERWDNDRNRNNLSGTWTGDGYELYAKQFRDGLKVRSNIFGQQGDEWIFFATTKENGVLSDRFGNRILLGRDFTMKVIRSDSFREAMLQKRRDDILN